MCERRPRRLAALWFASTLVVPQLLSAQGAPPHTEDASAPPAGVARLRVLPAWTRYDSRFTATGNERLGAALTADGLGADRIPQLGTTQSLVAAASASPFTLSLGRATLNAIAREVVIPFALEYGITNRLSVGVLVPVVQKRGTLLFLLDSTGSNVGPNPARTSSTAAQLAIQLQSEFATAASQLQARLQTCQSNPGAPGCASVIGREAEAQALIAASQAFAGQLATLFGSATESGMTFVPRATSAPQAAIAQRIEDFNTLYRDFLSSSVDLLVAVPMGAGGGAGSADVQRYLVEELGRDSLTTQERLGIGDVEIGARFLVVDAPRSATRRAGLTVAVASSVRLPTGSRQSPSELVDVRLGEGSVVVDSRAAVDARVGWLGLLATGQVALRIGEAETGLLPESGLAPPSSESWQRSSRSAQLHLAPRWHISEPFAFHGAYSLRTTDRSGSDQLVGAGVSFSTLAAYRSGASRAIPMEMRFTHLEALAGDPGRPKFFRDQIEVRIYYRLRR